MAGWKMFQMFNKFNTFFLGGGSNDFLFPALFGKMIQFDKHIFQMGWNHQLEFLRYLEDHHPSYYMINGPMDLGEQIP